MKLFLSLSVTVLFSNIATGLAINDANPLVEARDPKPAAKKSVQGFVLKEPQSPVPNLRKSEMVKFLDSLGEIALPRVVDFRGKRSNNNFDARGNFEISAKDHLVIPEIDYEGFARKRAGGVPVKTKKVDAAEIEDFMRRWETDFKKEK
ncbi:Ribosomal protein L5 [Glarea lozoyensis ATCC 20868]|uniref:Ribosomal protein L5 n=1 Tax=Glarea lozoyensis (strain ATCC 20868 / MF5171) TaxID=1116229 RepID=S3DJ33_GLAL2|nr:Ribosomal protein L5 [Glarea lozoyensis ATCC 20868]EPE37159.1 Ribosomal protein L5 [Glarea lozoyensis ATCC 20868]